jgi:hypothetical protein
MFIGTIPNFGGTPTGSITLIMVSQREPRRRVLLKIGEWSRRFFRQAAGYGAASRSVPGFPALERQVCGAEHGCVQEFGGKG